MSKFDARLKKIEQSMPGPTCKHQIGLLAPSQAEIAEVRQQIERCPACKGKSLLKIFTVEKVAAFREMFVTVGISTKGAIGAALGGRLTPTPHPRANGANGAL